ncbi:restriction endonuclease [Agrococcus citreus]|uniref:Restriction endonuclease n=1 Tax=Agrococcus citreus TaxID=84643 RepID=A0ABN1YWM3_9MICO
MPVALPTDRDLEWHLILALRALGGSATLDELDSELRTQGHYSEEQQAVLHGDGPRTELNYRLAWRRTRLKGLNLLENSERGVWRLTRGGRDITRAELYELRAPSIGPNARRDVVRPAVSVGLETSGSASVGVESNAGELALADEDRWQESLLDAVMQLSPSGFERLAQRILREAGFVSTRVLGRPADGGIDGVGVYRVSLLSFKVYFQCKRYAGSVGSPAVRDFRGAMAGRGDKGLLITTGEFTSAAREEASRAGAAEIDLIDGMKLCQLLKDLRIGVSVSERLVEDVTVDPRYFRAEFDWVAV